MNILGLLQEKNNCLEKFYRLNEAALLAFEKDDFDQLETFYNDREGILAMVRRVDQMLERSNQSNDCTEITAAEKKSVIDELDYKNELVTRILAQDLQILSAIEVEKSNIIKELRTIKTAKKAVGGYHSGEREKVLDEKA